MFFATVHGEKHEAKPKMLGTCPLCRGEVFSKCGEINVWHWAHKKVKSCDGWYEPETKWHKNWKLIFGKEHCEIVITKMGVRHIADVLSKTNVVIELQNSTIQPSTIRKREEFYGERMLWVVNGLHFKKNFRLVKNRIDEDEEYYRKHNPSSKYYGKASPDIRKEFDFEWKSCRKSWYGVQRDVFIDFGGEYLFWVKEGMGDNYGKGIKVEKQEFIRKYEGDLSLVNTIIEDENQSANP